MFDTAVKRFLHSIRCLNIYIYSAFLDLFQNKAVTSFQFWNVRGGGISRCSSTLHIVCCICSHLLADDWHVTWSPACMLCFDFSMFCCFGDFDYLCCFVDWQIKFIILARDNVGASCSICFRRLSIICMYLWLFVSTVNSCPGGEGSCKCHAGSVTAGSQWNGESLFWSEWQSREGLSHSKDLLSAGTGHAWLRVCRHHVSVSRMQNYLWQSGGALCNLNRAAK